MGKMQLLASYFVDVQPSDLFANGTVKLDYVGRRLTIDVPLNNLKLSSHSEEEDARSLVESGAPSFGLEVELAANDVESGSLETYVKETFMSILAGVASIFMLS